MSDSGLSAGEAGGIFAGVISVLGIIGGGFAWLAGWFERRSTSREGKLQRWHDELEECTGTTVDLEWFDPDTDGALKGPC